MSHNTAKGPPWSLSHHLFQRPEEKWHLIFCDVAGQERPPFSGSNTLPRCQDGDAYARTRGSENTADLLITTRLLAARDR